jgi:plasmid stability protein
MNAISIRRIEPELHAWLQEQAARDGVSMEEEVRRLLRAARDAAEQRRREEERARWEALFARAIKPPPGSPDSTEIIREMRDER